MPVSFWLTILLFVVIGFFIVNNVYWKNLRDEHAYRVKRWKELQQERQQQP